jgi:hypothetical protein
MTIIFPLRFWTNYKREYNKKNSRDHYSDSLRYNPLKYSIKIKTGNKYIHIRVLEKYNNNEYVYLCNKILISTVNKNDLKILKDRIYNFNVKTFSIDDIGYYIEITPTIKDEILNNDRLKHKTFFKNEIWRELIEKVLHPKRFEYWKNYGFIDD